MGDLNEAIAAVRKTAVGDARFPRDLVRALEKDFAEPEVRGAIWALLDRGEAEVTADRKIRVREVAKAKPAIAQAAAQAAT